LKGLSTNASTVTTSLWRDLTTAQIGVFAVGSAFWKTVFNLPLKSARTAAVCLLQCDQLPLPVEMAGGFIALRNVMQKAHVDLKKSRALIVVLCFTLEAQNTMLRKEHALQNVWQNFSPAQILMASKVAYICKRRPTISLS
tara:strand:+ start:145 stop:567 length:423 start_codon:yes stop_codon:yes gene_type:complete